MKSKRLMRFVSLMAALLIVFSLAACSKAGDAEEAGDLLARVKARGTLVIATEGDWAPWTYHDENGVLTGFDVEIGKLIAEELGVEAEFKETDWDSILAGVEAGRFDIACNGVGYTEERAKSYYFSDPYLYSPQVLVVRADNEDIKTLDDLKGKTTANTASSTYAEVAESYGATVTPVNTLQDTIELLLAGRVDATLNSKLSILDYLDQHPDAEIKIVSEDEGEIMVFPVARTDDAKPLIDEVNKILKTLRENGKLGELSTKYFGADLTNAD